jgi:hypothetical protein
MRDKLRAIAQYDGDATVRMMAAEEVAEFLSNEPI